MSKRTRAASSNEQDKTSSKKSRGADTLGTQVAISQEALETHQAAVESLNTRASSASLISPPATSSSSSSGSSQPNEEEEEEEEEEEDEPKITIASLQAENKRLKQENQDRHDEMEDVAANNKESLNHIDEQDVEIARLKQIIKDRTGSSSSSGPSSSSSSSSGSSALAPSSSSSYSAPGTSASRLSSSSSGSSTGSNVTVQGQASQGAVLPAAQAPFAASASSSSASGFSSSNPIAVISRTADEMNAKQSFGALRTPNVFKPVVVPPPPASNGTYVAVHISSEVTFLAELNFNTALTFARELNAARQLHGIGNAPASISIQVKSQLATQAKITTSAIESYSDGQILKALWDYVMEGKTLKKVQEDLNECMHVANKVKVSSLTGYNITFNDRLEVLQIVDTAFSSRDAKDLYIKNLRCDSITKPFKNFIRDDTRSLLDLQAEVFKQLRHDDELLLTQQSNSQNFSDNNGYKHQSNSSRGGGLQSLSRHQGGRGGHSQSHQGRFSRHQQSSSSSLPPPQLTRLHSSLPPRAPTYAPVAAARPSPPFGLPRPSYQQRGGAGRSNFYGPRSAHQGRSTFHRQPFAASSSSFAAPSSSGGSYSDRRRAPMPSRGGRFGSGRRGSPGRVASVSRARTFVASAGVYGQDTTLEQEDEVEQFDEAEYDHDAAQNDFEQAASAYYDAHSTSYSDQLHDDPGYEVYQDEQGQHYDNYSFFDEEGNRYDGEGHYEDNPAFVSFAGSIGNSN